MVPARIETDRAVLRRFTRDDLPQLRELESDASVVRSTGLRTIKTAAESAERLEALLALGPQREPLGVWGAWDVAGDDGFVGWLMLLDTGLGAPELGFMLPRRVWGRGWATHLAGALLRHGHLTLDLDVVVARTDADNVASRRVLHKLGFVEAAERAEPDTRSFVHRRRPPAG